MQEHACNPENAPGSVVIPDRAPPKPPHGDNASDFSGFYVSGGEMRALHDLHAASAAKIQRASLPRHMASYIGRSRGAERKRLSWCSQTHRALGASKEPMTTLSQSSPLSSIRVRKHHFQHLHGPSVLGCMDKLPRPCAA